MIMNMRKILIALTVLLLASTTAWAGGWILGEDMTVPNLTVTGKITGSGLVTANNLLEGYTTTATAAGTTTLTVNSTYLQYFTGSTTQTVKLPVTSTLTLGQGFLVVNNSSGAVTVQSSGANTLQAMAANSQLYVTCIAITGTGTASWNWLYIPWTTTPAVGGLAFGSDAEDDIAVRGASVYGRLNITEQTLVGRITGGHVAALSTTQIKTLLGYPTAGEYQTIDDDLVIYAGITPSANIQSFLGAANYAAMQVLLSIDHLITLTGVAEGSDSLGTFTGSTIADTSTVKTALQALETAVELRALSSSMATDNSTASHVLAKDSDGQIENLALTDGLVLTGTTSPSLGITSGTYCPPYQLVDGHGATTNLSSLNVVCPASIDNTGQTGANALAIWPTKSNAQGITLQVATTVATTYYFAVDFGAAVAYLDGSHTTAYRYCGYAATQVLEGNFMRFDTVRSSTYGASGIAVNAVNGVGTGTCWN